MTSEVCLSAIAWNRSMSRSTSGSLMPSATPVSNTYMRLPIPPIVLSTKEVICLIGTSLEKSVRKFESTLSLAIPNAEKTKRAPKNRMIDLL